MRSAHCSIARRMQSLLAGTMRPSAMSPRSQSQARAMRTGGSATASSRPPHSDRRSPGILVLGGGIIGCSVAWQLLRAGFKHVTILAKQFSPHTTSDIAGASIVPYTDSQDSGEQQRMLRWTQQTSDFMAQMRSREGTQRTGINLVASYEFTPRATPAPAAAAAAPTSSSLAAQPPWWAPAMHGFRAMDAREISAVLGVSAESAARDFEQAWRYTTVTVDVTQYLTFLHTQIEQMGGEMLQAEIESIPRLRAAMQQYNAAHNSSEASMEALRSPDLGALDLPLPVHALLREHPYGLLINCTGLGAKWNVPDPGVIGCKGVVLRVVHPPALAHCYSSETSPNSYIIPRSEDVTVGGTFGIADYDLSVPAGEAHRILSNAEQFVPDIDKAFSVKAMAGLRPYRSLVRLELVEGPSEPTQAFPEPKPNLNPTPDSYSLLTEAEIERMRAEESARLAARTPEQVHTDERAEKVPVVHCYGHGGSGITLSMGCAIDVLELARSVMQPTREPVAPSQLPSRL